MDNNSTNSTTSPSAESDGFRSAPTAPLLARRALRHYSHHLLDLTPGPDRLFKGLRESTRRNIRNAANEGVTVRFAGDLEAVKSYYRLHCLTRKRHGVPPQPFSFFGNLQQHLIATGQGFVALADYQGKAIAGAVFLTFGDRAIFKFGASDSLYHSVRPNNLVMWEAIRRLAEDGLRTLSFGRTDLGHTGLVQFKSGWGASENVSLYTRFDFETQGYIRNNGNAHPLYVKVFQQFPVPILKVFGNLFYKHFGA